MRKQVYQEVSEKRGQDLEYYSVYDGGENRNMMPYMLWRSRGKLREKVKGMRGWVWKTN